MRATNSSSSDTVDFPITNRHNPSHATCAAMSHTHFADIFRYILEAVKNSAGIEENTGTRFGGLGDLTAAANTSRMVSSDG